MTCVNQFILSGSPYVDSLTPSRLLCVCQLIPSGLLFCFARNKIVQVNKVYVGAFCCSFVFFYVVDRIHAQGNRKPTIYVPLFDVKYGKMALLADTNNEGLGQSANVQSDLDLRCLLCHKDFLCALRIKYTNHVI